MWVFSELVVGYPEMLGVLRRTLELSPARGELKGGGLGEWRLGLGSTAAHEVQRSELGRELGWSCSHLHRRGSTQLRTL